MSDKAAIVTGAGSGIGRAVCIELSRRGWALALIGRRRTALDETGSLLRSRWSAFPADIADSTAIAPLIRSILAAFPRVDALINNAGFAPHLPIEAHTPDIIREVFEVNAIATANLIAALWPTLIRQKGGRIINVSSIATKDPFPGFLAYAASKASVDMMAASCAGEGRAHGIMAFSVAPGAVETGMLRAIFSEKDIPPDRVLTPEAVARVIVACAIGDRDDQNGKTMYIPSP